MIPEKLAVKRSWFVICVQISKADVFAYKSQVLQVEKRMALDKTENEQELEALAAKLQQKTEVHVQ